MKWSEIELDWITLLWFNCTANLSCSITAPSVQQLWICANHGSPKGQNVRGLICFEMQLLTELYFKYHSFCFLFFFHPTDPEQLFVEPHYPTPYILGIYRHETSLVVPCRTTSPDTVVTLTGVRPHRDNRFILSAVCSQTEYSSTDLFGQGLSSKSEKHLRPLLILQQGVLTYCFRQFVLKASCWFSHPLCVKSIEHTETDQGQWRVWGKLKGAARGVVLSASCSSRKVFQECSSQNRLSD